VRAGGAGMGARASGERANPVNHGIALCLSQRLVFNVLMTAASTPCGVLVCGRPVYRGLGERPTARPGNGRFRDSHHKDTTARRNTKEELLSFPCLLVSLSPFPARLKARYLHDEGVLADWILARRLVGQILARLKGGEHRCHSTRWLNRRLSGIERPHLFGLGCARPNLARVSREYSKMSSRVRLTPRESPPATG